MRKRFCLVFTTDPPAADVVREDFVNAALEQVGEVCHFRWTKNKEEEEDLEGTILDIGTKTRLKSVLINKNGEQTADVSLAVGTRKQELEKLRLAQAHALANNLQGVAEILAQAGPEALPQPVDRRPKHRSPEELNRIKVAVRSLPCFTRGTNKSVLLTGKNVFCDAGKLALLLQHLRLKPKRHFVALLKVLIPLDLRRAGGLSSTGTRNTVKVPSIIVETALSYVRVVYQKAGRDPSTIMFDPYKVLQTLLSNSLKKNYGEHDDRLDEEGPLDDGDDDGRQLAPPGLINPLPQPEPPGLINPLPQPEPPGLHDGNNILAVPRTPIQAPADPRLHQDGTPLFAAIANEHCYMTPQARAVKEGDYNSVPYYEPQFMDPDEERVDFHMNIARGIVPEVANEVEL